ncbi:hypothetical protein BX616_001399, partial [Lobosporangium transversale]
MEIYHDQSYKYDCDHDYDIVMELCLDAGSALSRIQRSMRKSLASSTSDKDMMLRQRVGSAYYELARLHEHLGHSNDTQRFDKEARKWGYIHGGNTVCQAPYFAHFTGCSKQGSDGDNNSKGRRVTRVVEAIKRHRIATVPKDIFDHDVAPMTISCSLLGADEYLDDTKQLVYCLSLLSTSSTSTAGLTAQEQQWCQVTLTDQDEQERLRTLVSDVVTMFISDEIKTEATVTEVVSLAPVLTLDQFKALVMTLVNGVSQNIILDTHLLEGLVQLMQYAPLGYLDSDDLVTILKALSFRLQGVHNQSSIHLYRLSITISHILDAMVSSQVKGLKREQLHEPLAAYLKRLETNPEPYLVYQAAYAFQALLNIPNDETKVHVLLRRASAVMRGAFGIVSTVKNLDINAFMDELNHIQKELPSVTDVIDTSLRVYDGLISLHESGANFRQGMEEGLNFSHKAAWYPALRGVDALLQTGELTKLKTFVCEVACCRDPAFQWGLCERLGQVAANGQWPMDIRQSAVTFLGEIYKNDVEWGSYIHIKQWIVSILRELTAHPRCNLQ